MGCTSQLGTSDSIEKCDESKAFATANCTANETHFICIIKDHCMCLYHIFSPSNIDGAARKLII